ncbi:signal peptidase II [Nakamurella panacisegetis]|uniref:Lipoprotein signal peptidase n=1 Tax=Nakamurella panacisegetis TaxID=1090615 RepID=A0A1H0R3X1_9ACTN|nr:signal peptidase II [Nakamurella panacisegetis]
MARRDVWDTGGVNSSSEPEQSRATAPDDDALTSTDGPEAPAAVTRPLRPRRIGLVAVLALVIIVLDQVTKLLVVAHLDPDAPPKRILGGLVYLSLFRNAGAAFSTATGVTWILALVAIGVVVVIIRMASKLRSTAWAIALGLVLGGAVGNLIDRIFRSPGILRGHVVDFISLFEPDGRHFAVFNIADSGITLGAVALVLTAIFGIDMDGYRTKDKKTEADRG